MSKVKIFHASAIKRDAGTEIQTLEEWRVEEIDADGDGGIAMATFTGPFAEERARGHAGQLRGQRRRE